MGRWRREERKKADVGNRTPDLLITSELLCQLSYVGSDADGVSLVVGPKPGNRKTHVLSKNSRTSMPMDTAPGIRR